MWWTRKDGESRVERLLEENNALMRELLAALGRSPRTRATPPQEVLSLKPRGAESVFRNTRESVIAREREEMAKIAAPWRSGPDSEPMASTSGPDSAPPRP